MPYTKARKKSETAQHTSTDQQFWTLRAYPKMMKMPGTASFVDG